MRSLIILTIGLFVAQAQAADLGAFRFGIGVGKATIQSDDLDIEGSATAWEAFGGYEINRYVAVEAGYIDGGSADDTVLGATVRAETTAIVASVLGNIPISDAFSVYGRAGYMRWEAEESAKLDGFTIMTADVDGNDPFFGAGVSATVDGALLRLEYRAANLEQTDLSLISLAIAWQF